MYQLTPQVRWSREIVELVSANTMALAEKKLCISISAVANLIDAANALILGFSWI
jgi:hypothetical protein